MSRTNLFIIVIVALAVVAGVLGYQLYLDQTQPAVPFNVGPNRVPI